MSNPEIQAGEVKALYDALLLARIAVSSLVNNLRSGYPTSNEVLTMLERQYCIEPCPIGTLDVVVRSRKQFDDVAIENMHLKRENERLRNHIIVAREERDELIRAKSTN